MNDFFNDILNSTEGNIKNLEKQLRELNNGNDLIADAVKTLPIEERKKMFRLTNAISGVTNVDLSDTDTLLKNIDRLKKEIKKTANDSGNKQGV